MSRLRILSSSEQETFDIPLKFSHEPGKPVHLRCARR